MPENVPDNMSWPRSVRDMVITLIDAVQRVIRHSIDKGQLTTLGIIFLVAILFFRIPSSSLENVISSITFKLSFGSGLLNVMLGVGWARYARVKNPRLVAEIERLKEVNVQLQEQILAQETSNSN